MSAPIGRVQVISTGYQGAPGLTNLYWHGATVGVFDAADATAAIAAVHTLFTGVAGVLANTSAWQVQPTVETFEATTGALLGVVAGTPVASVAGTCYGNVAATSGPLLQWFTSTVVGRRLLRGRTFLIPSGEGSLNPNGTIKSADIATAVAAGNAYFATSGQKPVIWHRPVPFSTGSNGQAAEITACAMPGKVAVLTSRRD